MSDKGFKGAGMEQVDERISVRFERNEIQKIDSLHIACAISAKCKYFLTTDDRILRQSKVIDNINVNDPIGFIKEVLL